MTQSNYLAPDGYRYGVMFNDGSVMEIWNGTTQREKARECANALVKKYRGDDITAARRLPGQPWERIP